MQGKVGKIHSIESFGTVDGPGVRFVVFFQGCPMRCLYCHNPDTWDMSLGSEMTADEIIGKMKRNIEFYKKGGITATGGEPLLQLDFLTELFEMAKAEGIHTCLDTSGIAFKDDAPTRVRFERLLKATDLVMLDIKSTSEEGHLAITSHSCASPRAFARFLCEHGKRMRIRYVLVPGYTDSDADAIALGEYLCGFTNLEKLEILPYHLLGKTKYEALGIAYPLEGVSASSESEVNVFYRRVMDVIESKRG